MNQAVLVVLGSGVVTCAIKASGPLLLGRRPLPASVERCMVLAGPALLSALVVTLTFGGARHLVVDERAAGLAVAAACVAVRLPLPVTVVAAAVTTAALRVLHG